MKRRDLHRLSILLFLWITVGSLSPLLGEEELLHQDDVKKVMAQMFTQHVEKKEISADILKTSFRVYIEQFDPDRTYLLDSEVAPFLSPSSEELKKVLGEYKDNNFSIYLKINDIIQNSIKRARDNRAAVLALYQNDQPLKDSGTGDRRRFAQTPDQLLARQTREIRQFIGEEKGPSALAKFREYDFKETEKENPYLFIGSDGKPLDAKAKENLLTMHIIKALAKSLDSHTSFLNPGEAYDMRVRLEKGFDGVGIVLGKNKSGYQIVKILPGSVAESSGKLALNDYLTKIDGQSVSDETLGDVMKMLRGKNGTPVSLEIKREGIGSDKDSRSFNVVLKREPIIIDEGRVETSYVRFDDGVIGTIALESFYQGPNGISSERDVRRALEELEKKGPVKGLILDLRENSGGFLTQAVKVAGLFITNGVIVISKYSNGEEKFYRDMDGKVSYEGPMVVLTSRATASAAEIVAQALQDYGVALIVGDEQTYGKGTIQSQTVTNDETKGGSYFKVTVGKYYTVSGKTPQINGVKADVVVPSPYSLEQIGEEYLDYPIGRDFIPDAFVDSLDDIDPGLRPWYLRYYMPTLQQRNLMWRDALPVLKKNSRMRMMKNVDYKNFLKTGRFDEENRYDESHHLYGKEDPQLHEAINIVKDMIALEPKKGGFRSLGITRPELLSPAEK